MSSHSRVVLLNATCLDIVDSHRDWLATLPVEFIASQNFRRISPSELHEIICDSDAIIGQPTLPIEVRTMHEAKRLRVISLASSGFDSIDVHAATDAGIVVANAAVKEGSEVVADMTFGLMLAVSRQICLHDQRIRSGNFSRGMGTTPWKKSLGIVGLGNIGQAVVRRARAFEMTTLAFDPYVDREIAEDLGVELVSLDELFERSDYVSLHVRINDSTRGMIGYEQLRRMNPSSFLINTARRDLVCERDLDRALRENCLAGAGLDDPPANNQSPLLNRENVVFTTHLGNRARVGVDAVFRCAVQNAVHLLAGVECPYVVNPEVLDHARLWSKACK